MQGYRIQGCFTKRLVYCQPLLGQVIRVGFSLRFRAGGITHQHSHLKYTQLGAEGVPVLRLIGNLTFQHKRILVSTSNILTAVVTAFPAAVPFLSSLKACTGTAGPWTRRITHLAGEQLDLPPRTPSCTRSSNHRSSNRRGFPLLQLWRNERVHTVAHTYEESIGSPAWTATKGSINCTCAFDSRPHPLMVNRLVDVHTTKYVDKRFSLAPFVEIANASIFILARACK